MCEDVRNKVGDFKGRNSKKNNIGWDKKNTFLELLFNKVHFNNFCTSKYNIL